MNVLSKKYNFLKIIEIVTFCLVFTCCAHAQDVKSAAGSAGIQDIHQEIDQGTDQEDTSFDDFIIDFDHVKQEEEDLKLSMMTRNPDLDHIILALNLIKSPLWRHTKAPVGRDILYLLPHKITALEHGGIACNLFFNMTNRMQVDAGNLIQIESINQELLQTLLNAFFENIPARDILGLIPIFRQMTIQERKGGLLLQGGFNRGPFTIQFNTSLQFSERNFWLDKKAQQEIRDLVERITNTKEAAFDDSEGYRIKYGMGDTRIKLGVNTINATSFQMDVGIESIIPTSCFSHTPKLKSTLGKVESIDDLQKSAIGVLRNVRDFLLDPHLGNNGHFGVGCYVESKVGLFHDFAQLWMRLSYDRFFAGKENRLIMVKPTLTIADAPPNTAPVGAKSEFIKNFLMQYVFPPAFRVTVQPGGVLNFVTSVSFDFSRRWRYALGYDFYAQQRESIRTVHSSLFYPADLQIELAESVSARQHKIFTELMYYLKKREYADMSFGAGGDMTVASTGIGQDWTVYLKFAASF